MANKFKSSATVIPVEQSVGTIMAHDITEIRPGQFKGPAFKNGHIVTEEDLPHLKRVGKEHLYVLHLESGEVHEDDARPFALQRLLPAKACPLTPNTGIVITGNEVFSGLIDDKFAP
ncbi:MAG: hypothetical protein MUP26_00495, partial [Desulfobulbaceae bacterium]|nr:hypothetical protein [Desulfobulbaceae bacterium]